MNIRNEYPRPHFRRDDWLSLNGEWEFEFDDNQYGEVRGLPSGEVSLKNKIIVPFSYQYKESGIGDNSNHETLWYRRLFNFNKKDKRVLLGFNASDFVTDVYVNGKHAITHIGGFSPFTVDITKYLVEGENVLVVKCFDPFDPTTPRGKQTWLNHNFSCWYIANSGIWQSVWLDFVGDDAIDDYSITPDIDNCSFFGEVKTLYGKADLLEIDVYYENKLVKKQMMTLDGKYTRYTVNMMEINYVDEITYWTPEHPNLFYVDFILYQGKEIVDKVHTRFGMRKISVNEDGLILLNNKPLYQRLILDQGYWKDSGLTAPTIDDIKKDIELAKLMGFNGARKHQKFEDPYFYYYADELGFLAWCEMPSAYNFNNDEVSHQTREWQEIIKTASKFSSIITYVPLNESWGTRKILNNAKQQNYGRSLYYLTKALDNSRLVSTNDGWENLDVTDILSIHDYAYDSSQFKAKYNQETYDQAFQTFRKVLAEGNYYNGQPALLTEFGGIAMQSNHVNGNWGYNSACKDNDEFYWRLENLMKGIYETDFQGYCYTQLTDVQQEVNGLLDENHKPKLDSDRLKKIFENI